VRRTLLIGVSALALALAGAAAGTQTTPPPKEAECGQALVIVLFWPNGHGSIASVGLRADRKPHLEIYKYGRRGYPSANFLAYANSGSTARFGSGCQARIGSFPSGSIVRRLTAHKAQALSCRLPAGARIAVRTFKARVQVDVGTTAARVVSAKLRTKGSALDFSRSSCNPGKPPA
jgi:hypothetical protein